ncbi:MAG TPA: dihydrofolate reductase family protein [Nitrospirota bacterium]|nr:dihydrofolate reductase family protein [Nitrospirota bacterium]
MIIKASVFIATSLDGFIARKDGSIDWLEMANAATPKGENYGYQEFADSINVIVMGRYSYEKALTFSEWPYGEKPVIVLSSRTVAIPAVLNKTVSSSSEPPEDLMKRLSSQGIKHVYIDGGVTIQGFLAAGLIDELTITLIPVLLGEGRPLFGPLTKDIRLTHIATKAYENGFVQVKYRVGKDA